VVFIINSLPICIKHTFSFVPTSVSDINHWVSGLVLLSSLVSTRKLAVRLKKHSKTSCCLTPCEVCNLSNTLGENLNCKRTPCYCEARIIHLKIQFVYTNCISRTYNIVH
jgi:hypothetical protein